MAINVINIGGVVICMDAEAVLNAYGGHALRINTLGDMEVWLVDTDGGEWRDAAEAPLVQSVGKPTKARKQ